jgi:hypothetical protein
VARQLFANQRRGVTGTIPARRLAVALACALMALCPGARLQAGVLGAAEARNVAVPIYPPGALTPCAVVKVGHVFTEKRRMGFFRVKLLPVLVAQDVRLELGQSSPDTNWLAGFRVDLGPVARGGSVEWRDLSLWLPRETLPRLQVQRLVLPADPRSQEFALEGVTLQTETGPLKVPRARLWVGEQPGQVIWEENGMVLRWDLFAGKVISREPKQ